MNIEADLGGVVAGSALHGVRAVAVVPDDGIVTSPAVVLVVAPVAGFLADRFGRRVVLTTCLAIFGVFGGLAALAPTFEVLLVARFLQGVGSAALVNLAIVLIGFFTMIARQKAVTQMIAFLVMENGLFLGATAATYGMPLIVELGVFFDVLVAALIAGIYTNRLQDAFDSVDTSRLSELKE